MIAGQQNFSKSDTKLASIVLQIGRCLMRCQDWNHDCLSSLSAQRDVEAAESNMRGGNGGTNGGSGAAGATVTSLSVATTGPSNRRVPADTVLY